MKTIADLRNSFNKNINNEILNLKEKQEKQEKAMKIYDMCEKILNILPKIYTELKFTEYKNIHVLDNEIDLTFNCTEDFKPYMFVGYTRSGESININKCIETAEKYENIIKQHIYETLNYDVNVHVNLWCFEHHYSTEPSFVLVNIYFPENN